MKKNVALIINFILLSSIILGLFGCGRGTEEKTSGFLVYYIDWSGEKISTEEYQPKEKVNEKLIEELLNKLKENGRRNENRAAIPKEVQINGFSVTDGIVTIDFDQDYQNLAQDREVLCRSAVVLTLTQMKDVEYVAFTIDNYPYRQADGTFVGAMKASDFVSDLSGGNKTHASEDFVIYFANEDGSKLKEYDLSNAEYGEKSKETFIMEQLIHGPEKEGYIGTLSPNLRLINIVTANNICYVDFDDSFLTEQSKVSNQLVIYSIVNSLSELNEIQKVQISVNGDSELKYHDEVSLSEPFIRNLDLVGNNKDEIMIESDVIIENAEIETQE